jgi:protein arginine kinase activator
MLCDDCKSRPATIFYKEVLQDKVVELHLCEECAQKRGLIMDQKLSTTEILQKLLQKRSARDEQVICSSCCLSLAEFKRTGRFGCSQCVTAFQSQIKHLIQQIQQSERHVGRRAGAGVKRGLEVFKLREELKKALEQEAYEQAAKIRDKLRGYGVDHDE